MRKYLLLTLMIVSGVVFGQVDNFSIDNGNISWQNIYESQQDVASLIKTNKKIKIAEESDNQIIGYVEEFLMDNKGAGFSKFSTPLYTSESTSYNFDYKIDLKDGKYRVTIFNIKTKGPVIALLTGGMGIQGKSESSIEAYALKSNKTEFVNTFKKNVSKIMNYSFLNLFDVSKYSVKNDNW